MSITASSRNLQVCFVVFPCAHGVVLLVRVRSVHSRAPWDSFGCVRCIPARHGDRRVRSRAFGPFPCSQGVVGLVQVRSVHSRTSLGSSGSFPCVQSISVRPGGDRIHSGAFSRLPDIFLVRLVHSCASWGASNLFAWVWFIAVHPGVRSCAFGPFPYAIGIVSPFLFTLGFAFGPFTRNLQVL